jgi:hypothetical protein
MTSQRIIEQIAVTAELCGAELSKAAIDVMLDDLSIYSDNQVLQSLAMVRRSGRFSLSSIIENIDDGRPNPEEAWAMIPRSEDETVVMTSEMVIAFGVAQPLLAEGDRVAARMAFLEKYREELKKSRALGQAVKWSASLGFDKDQREQALTEAVESGKLKARHARKLLPSSTFKLNADGRKLLGVIKDTDVPAGEEFSEFDTVEKIKERFLSTDKPKEKPKVINDVDFKEIVDKLGRLKKVI